MIFFLVTKELEISFLSLCILRHETIDIDELSSMQDDPSCVINEKSIVICENF